MENLSPLASRQSSLPYIGQFIERFGFWGLQSLLVLYLIATHAVSSNNTYIVYGLFTACAFILAYFGGIITDKFIGFQNAILIGISLECCGNLLLFLGNPSLIYISLALIALGSSLFISNNPYLVTNKQHNSNLKKWNNMSLLYICENAGFILGLILYGFIRIDLGIKYCFLLSSCLLASYAFFLAYHLKFKSLLPEQKNQINANSLSISVILIAITCLVSMILKFSAYSNPIIAIIAVITIATFIRTIYRTKFAHRSDLLTLLIIYFISIVFFTVLFQMNSSIQMFIQEHVQTNIYNWSIPSSSFASLESMFAIICAPLFSLIWLQLHKSKIVITDIEKVALGLLFQAIGFFIFIKAMQLALLKTAGISPLLIVPGYLFLGAGDICLMATAMTTITSLTPDHLKSTLMGSFYLLIGFAGYLAGNLAELTVSTQNVNTTNNPLVMTINIFKNINHLAFIISLITLLICMLLQNRFSANETI
jgi:POT family proton-dependent oligopeptide transporter